MKFRVWLEAELSVGQIIDIPASGDRYPIKVKVAKISGDRVWLTQHIDDDDLIGSFVMSRSAVSHFINDLTGKVVVNKQTSDPYISKVLNGEGKYLGKGDDGVVFEVGDMIVKVSTTVPYIPTNPYHKTPAGAARLMAENVRLTEMLRKRGVPGILPTYYKIVGDKAFSVRPKVEIPAKLNKEQLEEVRHSLEAIHKAGYAIKDTIQVGIYRGKVYHYDLGKLSKGGKWDFDYDMNKYKMLLPQLTKLERKWKDFLDEVPFMVHSDEGERREWIKKFREVKAEMVVKFPDKRGEIESEFMKAIDKI